MTVSSRVVVLQDSRARPITAISDDEAGRGEHPTAVGAGPRTDGSDHRRHAGDADAADGGPGDGVAGLDEVGAGGHYIRLDGNDYSVHPSVIGRRIEVIADLDRVRAVRDGRSVAEHERIWAWHQAIADPKHVDDAKMLRRNRVSMLRPAAEPDVEVRCLADYDAAHGVTDEHQGGVAGWLAEPPPDHPRRRTPPVGTSRPRWRS